MTDDTHDAVIVWFRDFVSKEVLHVAEGVSIPREGESVVLGGHSHAVAKVSHVPVDGRVLVDLHVRHEITVDGDVDTEQAKQAIKDEFGDNDE